jgi:NAD-dependent dihydropyrimidine dehydrogenase PreA subunit
MTDPNADPSAHRPIIDRNRCEGKAACVPACPWDALVVAPLPKVARQGLSLRGILKGYAHGWQQAVLVDPSACRGCRMCEAVCPEQAIYFLSDGGR